MGESADFKARKETWQAGDYNVRYAPRRLRTAVCPHLREDGQPVPQSAWQALWARLPKTVTSLGHKSAKFGVFRCAKRNAELFPAYVTDLCASSWCKECEFRAAVPMRSAEVSLSFQRRSA